MKICFHVDQEERWATCLANIFNTLAYFEKTDTDERQIAIVVNAAAVKLLDEKNTEQKQFAQELSSYMTQGVKVLACQNALLGHGVASENLLAGVEVVAAGIITLAEMQNQGYAYIRP